jgi:sugar phosphate isomerase/epimerase
MDALPLPRLPLSLALVGITSAEIGTDPRAQIAWAGGAGYHAVQLDATAATVRPRELDRSGRRDVAALLRRNDLVSSGVDLFIPSDHLTDPAHADRAMGAMLGAIVFCAELAELTGGMPVLSTVLPHEPEADGIVRTIAEAAQSHGVRVADCAWPPSERHGAESPIGVGVDPATVSLAGDVGEGIARDPAAAVSSLRGRLAGVRLSDIAASGRVAPGEGRLDELAYVVAIATSAHRGYLVVDLRGVRRQGEVARDVVERLGRGAGTGA